MIFLLLGYHRANHAVLYQQIYLSNIRMLRIKVSENSAIRNVPLDENVYDRHSIELCGPDSNACRDAWENYILSFGEFSTQVLKFVFGSQTQNQNEKLIPSETETENTKSLELCRLKAQHSIEIEPCSNWIHKIYLRKILEVAATFRLNMVNLGKLFDESKAQQVI